MPDPSQTTPQDDADRERNRSRARIRRWLTNIHMYGGLLSAAYLIPIGISSLQFNHRYGFTEGFRSTSEWTRTVAVPEGAADGEVADAVHQQLGFTGWSLPWTFSREQESFRFQVEHPGRHYALDVDLGTGIVTVQESPKKIWAVFRGLHGAARVPGSPASTAWWLYMNVSVVIVLFSAASGVYLWYVSGRDRRSGWVATVSATVVTAGFVLYFLA